MSNMVKVQQLEAVVGKDIFNKIIEKFGGKNIYIPKRQSMKHINRKSRNQNIKEDYYKGIQVEELVTKYELSRSRIYKIIESK